MLTAFVIMPFSSEFNAVFEGLITPALDGYDVIRADTRFDQRSILEKIVSGITEADLIVADITALNPNVMYELGIAHTLGKPVIMITQNIEELPFDVSAYTVHEYSTHFQRAKDLQQKLRELSLRHQQGLVLFGSPVRDFLPTTRPARSSASTGESVAIEAKPHINTNYGADENAAPLSTSARDDMAQDLSSYGYLDFAADLEEHGGAAAEEMGHLNTLTVKLTERMTELTPAIKAARDSSAPGSAYRARQLTNELANELQSYSRALEKEVIPRFHESWAQIGQSLLWLLGHDDRKTADDEDLEPLRRHTVELHDVLNTNIENMKRVRKLYPMLRGQTRELTRAADEADRALGRLMGEYAVAVSYLARIQEHLSHPDSTPPTPPFAIP